MSSSARAIANATSRQQQPQQVRPRESVSNNPRQSNQQYTQNVYQQRAGQPVSRQQIQTAQMQAQAAAMAQMQAAYNQHGQGQMQGQMQNPMYEPEQQPVNRVSVTDAISLLSLRMNKFESMVGKLQEAMNELKTTGQPNGSVPLNDSVLKGLLMRIEQLEKGQSNPDQNVFIQQTNTDLTVYDEQINRLAIEVADTKDMLLKLQTFSIDTTQKLVDKILSGENKEEDTIFVMPHQSVHFTNIHDLAAEDQSEVEELHED